tara:strand:- start:162 stop:467 length:306 start_codon:yes stop_codon:yes gene_type:complete
MPCRDYTEEDVLRGQVLDTERRVEHLKEQCNKLTGMLCHVVGNVIDGKFDNALTSEVNAWYAEHRAADIRNLQSMFSNVDLNDLSKEEFDTIDKILDKYTQ